MHNPVLSVGIDVGKRKLDVACMRQDRTSVHRVFTNNPKGIREIKSFLKSQGTADTVPCTLEATGSYHYLVSLSLVDAGVDVKCINPLISRKYMRATIRNAKSDKIDAIRLAEIGLLEPNIQKFTTTRAELGSKARLATLRQTRDLLQKLRAHRAYLEEIKQVLDVSVPHRDLKKAIENLEQHAQAIQSELVASAPERVMHLARCIPGLSQTQAAMLFAAIGDKDFTDRDQLVAFAGLDCKVRQSGSWQGTQRISKRGSDQLRTLLYNIAWSLQMNNDRYAGIFRRKRAEGKHYKTCMIVIARAFLRLVYSYYWKKTISLEPQPKRQTIKRPRKSPIQISAPVMLSTA